jgi:hypothetical protein
VPADSLVDAELPLSRKSDSTEKYPRAEISCRHTFPLFSKGLEQPLKQDLAATNCEALTGSLKE